MIKPHVSRLFGVEKEQGLLDLLANPDLDPRSLILPTDIPGLTFLPAGTAAENATELLASARMREVVAQLSAMDQPAGCWLQFPGSGSGRLGGCDVPRERG